MNNERYLRQGFLGNDSETLIANCRVAIVGLGGGGSHIAQALAYLGFMEFVLYDFDFVEETNLNRLIGAIPEDTIQKTPKVDVAERMIKAIQPNAKILKIKKRWQLESNHLTGRDIVFGCVDGYGERQQLESACRRYMIPYIDIGLDVHIAGNEAPQMAGQVILSLPGHACMWCMGYLSDEKIGLEVAKYGQAGVRAQVVYANGVLANTAIGIALDLITDWTRSLRKPQYLLMHSNSATVKPHPRIELLWLSESTCVHYPVSGVGNTKSRKL